MNDMGIPAKVAAAILLLLLLVALSAGFWAPADYAFQFRDEPGARPSARHPMGTDDLGRDRLARLLYGSRVSLLLAPAAALLSTLISALVGSVAGFAGGWTERVSMGATDLFLSLPWLFLLITVRALLPLNASPALSIFITFVLLGALGWAASARVVCAGTRNILQADYFLLGRACGYSRTRLLFRHVWPNLRPILFAQFLISIPAFILAEANLGLLGLGVSEPLPSWGTLLRDLENWSAVARNPWLLAPLALLLVVVSCFHLLLSHTENAT